MNTCNKLSKFIILTFLVVIPCSSTIAQVWSNRIEHNFTLDGEHWGVGGRLYMNYSTSHAILRYKFDGSWSSQYRYVTKKGGDAIEHWFRLQHKDLNLMSFFLQSRIEYRIKVSSSDVILYRPQIGFKLDAIENVKAYYIAEPQWEYDFGKREGYFKVMQHFFGFDIELDEHVSFGPFIEIDTNDEWQVELIFLGTQLEVKI